jgi:SpoIIAA-like
MSNIRHQYQSHGIHLIRVDNQLEEKDIADIIDLVGEIYQRTEATYVMIDLKDNYALSIRLLAAEIKRCYREYVGESPLYLAIVVESSLAQAMMTVLDTLMGRDPIQLFTREISAQQWLMLERRKIAAN